MSLEEELRRRGDRHLRHNESLASIFDPSATAGRRVRLQAAGPVAATMGGQHTLWMLLNLLVRQFGVVHAIEILVPDVPLLPGVAAFGASPTLAETLLQTALLAAGDRLEVSLVKAPDVEVDVEVCVGHVAPGPARTHVGVLGSGWKVAAGSPGDLPTELPVGSNPFGPYFAACLGAGEVFKRLQGLLEGRGRFAAAFYFSLWDGEVYDAWAALPLGVWDSGLKLPAAYLIGGGAVGQAVAAGLRASGLEGHITVCEGEAIDEDGTNLNRYVLAMDGERGIKKADILVERMKGSNIQVFPHQQHWPGYVQEQPHTKQRPDLQMEEAAYRYGVILSCVDKNPARHSIQNHWPGLILGGSTLDLGLEVNAYDMSTNFECLKCNNPIKLVKTREDVAADLRRMSLEDRRAWAEARKVDLVHLESYLEDPKCGMLGASAIAKFAGDGEVSWSVGFVSVAAGVLLAAQLVLRVLRAPGALPTANGHMRRFNFLYLRSLPDSYGREETCDCSTSGREMYARLWGPVPQTTEVRQ